MTDADITIASAYTGEDPTGPIVQNPSFLQATRKYAVGNGTTRLNGSAVIGLPTIPTFAQSAILVLEAADGADKSAALGRFWMDGTWPNAVKGLPMYHGSVIEIICKEDLDRTRIYSTDGGNHKINAQYFSAP